jgi:CRP/FNR family transcriptional regulator, cyclic AMP receptor protein
LDKPAAGEPGRYVAKVDDAVLLKKTELFEALDPDALSSILAHVERRAFGRGDVICQETDEANCLYVVRTGRVAISIRSPEAKESIVALMEAGDLFGEMPLFDGESRSAGARALEPTDLLMVPYEPIKQALVERPSLLWHMVALLARRLRVTDAALADSMFLDVPGRTAKRLIELAGVEDEFTLPVTQEELAAMVGASRERVNKALSQFVRLGWITMQDRRYRIDKREELERRAR